MLFSEPKIPQSILDDPAHFARFSFSALQRAENSSIFASDAAQYASEMFQCSSASRKFLNSDLISAFLPYQLVSVLFSEPKIPQSTEQGSDAASIGSFSALQRAENSSIKTNATGRIFKPTVSVLFSEPKIPQSCRVYGRDFSFWEVSVLFSEPKIPQFRHWFQSNCAIDVSVLFSEPKIPQS